MKTDNVNRLVDIKNTSFQKNCLKKLGRKKGGGHFDQRWEAENIIRSSSYSFLTFTTYKTGEIQNVFFKLSRNKNFFESLTLTLTYDRDLRKK